MREIDDFVNSPKTKISKETSEILHYASLIENGFNLNYNDFTLMEQELIVYAVSKIRERNKKEETKNWAKFFNKGFEYLGKQISKIHL